MRVDERDPQEIEALSLQQIGGQSSSPRRACEHDLPDARERRRRPRPGDVDQRRRAPEAANDVAPRRARLGPLPDEWMPVLPAAHGDASRARGRPELVWVDDERPPAGATDSLPSRRRPREVFEVVEALLLARPHERVVETVLA